MKSRKKASPPSFDLEDLHNDAPVCGLDEVGRGPLAGPVVAACVLIPSHVRTMDFIPAIRDSKTLSEAKREALYSAITTHCMYGLSELPPEEIDRLNILQASLTAMTLAYSNMNHPCAHALIDGNRLPVTFPCSATAVIKGDSKSISIAAASIIAKVTRDRIMRTLHNAHPQYGWDRNMGYPTAEHRAALERHGITQHHRKTFGPLKGLTGATKT